MRVDEIDEGILYEYIGARGLGIRLLTDITAAQINPLSPPESSHFYDRPLHWDRCVFSLL